MSSSRKSGRLRRLALRAILVLAAAAVLLVLGLVLALKAPAVRQAVLRSAGDAVAASAGVHATARDFALVLRRGELTIDALELRAAPDAEPFLRVDRVRAEVRIRSLLGDRVVVRSLRIDGARADLGAPLPEAPESEEPPAEAAPPAIDVEELVLSGGAIDSGPLAADLETWLDAWQLDGVELSGSYRHGALRLVLPSATFVAESRRRPQVQAALRAEASHEHGGIAILEVLDLEGDGLELTAKGLVTPAGRPRPGQEARSSKIEASFSLRAAPALLLPDLAAGGRVVGEGELTLADDRLDAEVRLDVQELPAEILRPLIAAEGLELEGTVLDVAADLRAELALAEGNDPLDRLVGDAEVAWRRGDERLVAASLRSRGDGPGIRLGFEAEVLPGETGTRRLAGELRAQRWLALDEGELAATRFDLEVPDLKAATARLGLAGDLGGFRPAGEVRASADAAGPLLHPDLRLDATWLLDGETLAGVRARTLAGFDVGEPLNLAVEAELLPASAGHRRLAGRARIDDLEAAGAGDLAGTRLEDLRLDVEVPDLAAAARELRRSWRTLFPDRELPAPLAADSALAAGGLALTARADGPVLAPRLEADADWRPAPGEHAHLELAGDATAESPFFAGQARLRLAELDAGRFAATEADGEDALEGRVSATLDFDGELRAHQATLDAEITGLRSDDGLGLERLVLAARSDGSTAEIDTFTGALTTGQPFSGQGHLNLAPPFEKGGLGGISGQLHLELSRPIETLERLVAQITLDGGSAAAEIALDDGGGALPVALVRAPLTALAAGEGQAWLALSGLELEPFLPLLALDEGTLRPRARFDGELVVDLADPAASNGTIEISGLAFEGPKASVEATEPLRLELRDRRFDLAPARLLGSGDGALKIHGGLELAPDWRPGDDPATLAGNLALDLDGSFETSVLNPLLAGARASGELEVALEVRGTPAAPEVAGRFDGAGVELFSAAPYVTRVASPIVELAARHGGTLFRIRARLNGGDLSVSGSLDRDAGLALLADFSAVRYRLDYGLTTRLAGDLELRRPADGPRSRLTGTVELERGSMRNDLVLDRETLARLLAPDMTSVEDAGDYDLVDLDLAVTTAGGVSVKNNLGQLRAGWDRLRVRGTLQKPVIAGRIDVDPGGKLHAYGQTLRIDEASIAFSGDSAAPRIVFQTTSSLDDPSIREDRRSFAGNGLGDEGPGGGGYWQRRNSGEEISPSKELTSGVIDHLTDRAAGSLTRGLERTELSLEPLPIFGETDTTARLTATQQLSAEADLIYSVNPRDAEGQTYILELHDADIAPSLTAQLFTNDDNNTGVTLQQTLQLGAGKRSGEQGRRLGGIRIHAPEAIESRRLKKALGVRKRDPFPEDAEFDAEVDAIAALRSQGYPAAQVKVTVESEQPQLPVLDVAVEPGPRVRFIFEGTRPAAATRRQVAQLYSFGAEETSLEAMRKATAKALRGQGYLEPRVEVTAEVEATTAASSSPPPRTVRVTASGGRRVAPGPPVLEGLPLDVAEEVAGEFESRLSRVELAIAEPGADRYLLQTLATFGYPGARVAARELSADGEELVVRLEPGRRQHIARVEILGLAAENTASLEQRLPVQPGDAMRSDRVTGAAHWIEDELRRRGHARAAVRTSLEPAAAETSEHGDLLLRFEVDAGPIHRLADVRLQGLRGTRDAWAARIAGLTPETVFRDDDVGKARRRLMATGLFEAVRTSTGTPVADAAGAGTPAAGTPAAGTPAADTSAGEEAPAPDAGTATDTTVIFNFEERPRYRLSYGGRWKSGEGIGVVVDAVDQSFLGRGTTLGLRAIYSGREERSLRLYHAVPRVLGPKSSLELFLEGKNEELEGLRISGVEAWTQLTFALSRRARNRLYFRYQDLSFAELGGSADGRAAGDSQRAVIPSIGWQYSFDTRDRSLGARRPDGLAASIDLVGSHGDLGSDVSGLGVFSQLKLFSSLTGRRTAGQTGEGVTWAQSYRVGLQEPFENTEIPIVSRLRAGGEYSVRGYRRESLGPLDQDGDAVGGELFVIFNQELRFPIWGGWLGGLVFFDAGNVWETREAFDSELFTSAGVGLRAATPAGPLRLDVALPLDRRPEIDDSIKVYLGFGHVF